MIACDECGFDAERIEPPAVPAELAGIAARFAEVLAASSPDVLTRRPRPEVWSPQEYASHVRDVLLVQRERVVLARVEERPSFARMHRDERVAMCGYAGFSTQAVLDQLQMAGTLCAATFGALEGSDWSRRFVYNWPAPAERDLAWLARHTLHEGTHHLFDVRRILVAPDGRTD